VVVGVVFYVVRRDRRNSAAAADAIGEADRERNDAE
jgi:cbb3-type cytochrome oxidase subunit 3